MIMKKLMIMSVAALMTTALSATPAMASGWQHNSTGWWYGTNADNSTWYTNGWQWVDGNGDGTAECYYFDQNGYALMNATTPDGYTVDGNGAWMSAGKIQTKWYQMKILQYSRQNCMVHGVDMTRLWDKP